MQVYLDNAATTPIEPVVLDAMMEVMRTSFGNPSSIHAVGRKAKTFLEKSRKEVAQVIGASTGEVFFTSSATESNNTAIICAVRDLGIKHLISSPTEHPCVLNSISYAVSQYGCSVDFLDVDEGGNIGLQQLEQLLNRHSDTMVCLMHGNNEIGTISDIESISKLCEQHGALFHCDAVQTIGKVPIDLSKTRVNFLSGSGHKIYGPKGVGMLYVRSDTPIQPLIRGGGQERKMRSGTENVYGIVGFATALSWLSQNRESHMKKITDLRNYFKALLIDHVPGIDFHGNQDAFALPNILSTSIPRTDRAEMAMFNLDINGICASAGSACSSGAEQASHVISAIGVPANRKTIRFSFSHHNTQEELDYAAAKMCDVVEA